MRTLIGTVFAASLLTACASPQQPNAALEHDVDTLISTYGPTCEKHGKAINSHQWRNCVYQLSKRELSDAEETELDFPLIHRLGQRLGLIRNG